MAFFSQEGRPFTNKPTDPHVVYVGWTLASFVMRKNVTNSRDDDPRVKERARDTDGRRLALVYHLSAGCLHRSGLQSWTRGALVCFFRRAKSSDDVHIVLRNVYVLIDCLTIKESMLVRGRLIASKSKKLSKSFY